MSEEDIALPTVRVVLIEDSVADSMVIQQLLDRASSSAYTLRVAGSLEEGLLLVSTDCDAVLLDLGLPDSQGAETCQRLIARAPYLPVVVLTGSDESDLARQALQCGAQDYLVKGRLDAELLSRSLQYAIERKQISERLRVTRLRYQTLVEATSAIVWSANERLDFSTTGDAWTEFTGQNVNDVSGRGWLNAFHPDDRETLQQICDTAVECGLPFERELRLWHSATQSHRCVKLRAVPMHRDDDQTSVVEWIGEVSDIDDQRQQELQLRRSRRLASLGTLTAGIAHEINNPLQAAWSSAQAARNHLSALPDDGQDAARELKMCLENVCRSTRRCGEIVDHMLQFSRGGPSERVRQRLDTAIEHALVYVGDFALKQKANIRVECSDPIPVAVINTVEIEQLVGNLVRNAIQTSDKGVNVTISAGPAPEAPRFVRLAVEDDGPGIADSIADQVFDPFFTQGDHQGTGLGLTIVHEIVQEHGGTIRLEPLGHRGTRVVVDLPAG